MRIPRTRLVISAVIAAALLALAMIAAGAASAATPGYTWIGSGGTYGIGPSGLELYVMKGSRTASMTAAAQYTVAQQRRYGIKISWGGYSMTYTRTNPAVVLYQATSCPRGMAGFTKMLGGRGNGSTLYRVASATIKICPLAFQSTAVLRSVILHEGGHAVGLGHFAGSYRGHEQVMNPSVQHPPLQTYQAGDINGLKAIAANSARLANAGH